MHTEEWGANSPLAWQGATLASRSPGLPVHEMPLADGHTPCKGAATMPNRFPSSRLELARHRTPIDGEWDDVSEYHPCPVCGADSRCSRHVDDAFVSCARRSSEWPLTNGGWLHRVTLSKEAPQVVAASMGQRT